MGELRPMLAELAPAPFDSIEYLFEPKWDGVRCLAYVSDELRLEGRAGSNLTYRFPEISREEVKTSLSLVLDGELICGDGSTKSFRLIQGRVHKEDRHAIRWASMNTPATLMVFDILEVNGVSVLRQPLWSRKTILDQNLRDSPRVRHTPFVETEGKLLFETLVARGYEGIMAKHRESPYLLGKRSSHWLKMKVAREGSFFAVGLTEGKGARADTFGALVLASDQGDHLAYRGEVGTGFTDSDLKTILSIAEDAPRYFSVNGVRWIKPIRCRVKFLDETPEGKLRFPVFKRLEEER